MSADAPSRITHRRYVSYIDKSREYYAAHGYGRPYRWARQEPISFTRPSKPLSEMTVGVVTTAHPWNDDDPRGRPAGKKHVCAVAASPIPERLYTHDLSWDKEHTSTDDLGSFLPLEHLESLAAEGVIGGVSGRFYSVPTEYSQRQQREKDGPEIALWCAEDDVDLVLLVPL